MKTKKCKICGETKPGSEFHKRKKTKDGLHVVCKSCRAIAMRAYHHSKKGLISIIYNSQIQTSKRRGDPPPSYTKLELKEWLYSQKKFHVLFDQWKRSGFHKNYTPSVDRKNDYLPYTMDNIQLMTWAENKAKGIADRVNGINNKVSKPVGQYDIQGRFVKSFYSIRQAERETGIDKASIVKCCKGRLISAGGYIWKYL